MEELCPHVTYIEGFTPHVDKADCARKQDCPDCLLAFAAAAVKERDFQWWEAIACVDNVPPTPEGCKWWVINTQEHWVKEARAEERRAWIEYTQFVRDANDAWIVLAHVHGMRASAETVQIGKEMRAALGVEWEGGKLVDLRARREGPGGEKR